MSILKVWQLTLILAKQDSMGRGYTEKMAFLHSSDEKTWFLTFPLIFKWSQMGGFKKASLYVYFEGLTTDSYFGKARLPGERLYRKNGFFTLFWWENMISDLSINFQMVKNGGFKKASLYVYFEGLTTDSYSAKQDTLGRGHIEKKLFYTLLMRKHDFWPFH